MLFIKVDVYQTHLLLLPQVKLAPLYSSWSESDPVFQKISEGGFGGIRILRQDPVENVFSFICSSNNNIQRISSMVESLCTSYGDRICSVDEQTFHSFPSVSALNSDPGMEKRLRELGFGYRAGYIAKSARQIRDMGGEDFLMGLRKKGYDEAREELMKLTGVGPKVADCILLVRKK